jgi:hypothetical protein
MTQVYSNDISAVTPEIWSTMIEVPLYKNLVGTESLANTRFESQLVVGDTVKIQRFGSLSAKTYTPGTTISATAQDWLTDNLVVSTTKVVSIYRDDVHQLQANVDLARELAQEMAYQLADKIDQHIFANITGADGFTVADAQDVLGGTNARPISAGSANILQVFTGAKKILRNNNVEERGDWCAIISPGVAAHLENKLATAGYNVADTVLRNGYMGDVLGFQVFISKNLPSGSVSVIAPNVSGAANSATTAKAHYFGRKGMVDLVLQKRPSMEIRKKDDMLGSNFMTWSTYGSTVTTFNRSRGLNVPVQSGFF